MGLATHLGPWLLGTVKNSTATSTTVATTALGVGFANGSYRNTGATTCIQTAPGAVNFSTAGTTTILGIPGNVVNAVATTASSTTMTLVGTTAAAANIFSGMTVVGPGIVGNTTVASVSGSTVTLSAATSTTVTAQGFQFFNGLVTNSSPLVCPTNMNPMILPAGAYIKDIIVDVLTAFNPTAASGGTSSITIQLLNSTGTYVLGVVNGGSGGATMTIPVGRYSIGTNAAGSGTASDVLPTASSLMYLNNVRAGQNTTTDQIVQAVYAQAGTTLVAATTGLATVSIEYAVRNPDGTSFPQTPNITSNPLQVSY